MQKPMKIYHSIFHIFTYVKILFHQPIFVNIAREREVAKINLHFVCTGIG